MNAALHPLQIQALAVRAKFFPVAPTRLLARPRPKPQPQPVPPLPASAPAAPQYLITSEYGPWIAPLRRGDGSYRLTTLLRIVREASGVPLADIKSTRRNASTVKARQIFCWLAKRFTSESYPSIARHIGGRDHTTVLHAVQRVEAVLPLVAAPSLDDPREWADVLLAINWPAWNSRHGGRQ